MTGITATPHAAAAALASSYGGFRLGEMHLALPMTALREVLALEALCPLPCPAACVVGGIELRGVLVPVIDLRVLLDAPADRPDIGKGGTNVVIMVHGGRLVGLLSHTVTGIFTSADGSLVQSRAGEAETALFAGSVRRGTDDALVCLLSPEAVCALPEVPLIDDPEPERMRAHGSDGPSGAVEAVAADESVSLMLLRCGAVQMVIDAIAVQSTLVNPVVGPSALAMGACRGVLEHGDRRIAAVDLNALCGFGGAGGPLPANAFVLELETGRIALLVDEVIDIVRVPHADLVDLSPLVPTQVAIFKGVLPAAILGPPYRDDARYRGTHFLYIDAGRLLTVPDLLALARMNTLAGSTAAAGTAMHGPDIVATTATQRAMICYEVSGALATPLDQVAEILPFRAESTHFDGARVGGLVVDRGRSIAIVSLGKLLDPAHQPGHEAAVLVVQSDAHWVGFAVTRLLTIEPARWEPELPPTRNGRSDLLARTLGQGKLALFGAGPAERMLRVLDLAQLARIVLDEHEGQAVPEGHGAEATELAPG